MSTDLRALVECLLTAHYSEREILDYLTGPLGYDPDEAGRAVYDTAGPSRSGVVAQAPRSASVNEPSSAL